MKFQFLQPFNIVLIISIPLLIVLSWRILKERRSGGKKVVIILRSIILLLLVLSLSGLSLSQTVDQVNVMFVLDISESLDEVTRSLATRYITKGLEYMGENDTAGVIVFGREALVEIAPQNHLKGFNIASDVTRDATDISAAVRLAFASFPEKGEKRIILLSDGNENKGHLLDAAAVAKSLDVRIFVVPLYRSFGENEVFIKDLFVPLKIKAGQVHELDVDIYSVRETPARLTIFKDGHFMGFEEVMLEAGENRFSYQGTFDEKGLHRYEVLLSAEQDTILENNGAQAFVNILGEPAVFYVSEEGMESRAFIKALEEQDIKVSINSITDIPDTMGELIEYDVVILDNVPGYELSFSGSSA